jgi:hypothetical protein
VKGKNCRGETGVGVWEGEPRSVDSHRVIYPPRTSYRLKRKYQNGART